MLLAYENLSSMVYSFCILSGEIDEFYLRISIDSSSTFEEFNQFLQESLGYDQALITTFDIVDKNWNKLLEITPIDTGFNLPSQLTMHTTTLESVIKEIHSRLIYRFDILNDRAFFIELIDITMEKNLKDPVVIAKQGNTPEQVVSESFISGVWVPDELEQKQASNDFGDFMDYSEIYGEMLDLQ